MTLRMITELTLVCLSLTILAGCGLEKASQSDGENGRLLDYPIDLRRMQGSWSADGENRLEISGHNIRLLFRDLETGQLYRRNIYIDAIDASELHLDIRGEELPWQYSINSKAIRETLSLRFYDKDNHRWVSVALLRAQPEN